MTPSGDSFDVSGSGEGLRLASMVGGNVYWWDFGGLSSQQFTQSRLLFHEKLNDLTKALLLIEAPEWRTATNDGGHCIDANGYP